MGAICRGSVDPVPLDRLAECGGKRGMAVAHIDGGEARVEERQIRVIELAGSRMPRLDRPKHRFEPGSDDGSVAVDRLRCSPAGVRVFDPPVQEVLDRLAASDVTAFRRVGHQLGQCLGRLATGAPEGPADLPVLARERVSSRPCT